MSREARVQAAVLPDVNAFDKEDMKAARAMMLLHTLSPPEEDDLKVDVVRNAKDVKKAVKSDDWPKQRRVPRK
jgi:hypothetical protein